MIVNIDAPELKLNLNPIRDRASENGKPILTGAVCLRGREGAFQ